jgi:hypothetical protein
MRTLVVVLALCAVAVSARNVCGDSLYCKDSQTCCKDGDSYKCCPYREATCCDDGLHCCPSEYPVCDTRAGVCSAPHGKLPALASYLPPQPVLALRAEPARTLGFDVCSGLSSKPAKFICGLVNRIWSAVVPHSDLIECIEGVAISLYDFWQAGASIKDAFQQHSAGDDDKALHTIKTALGQFNSGLKELLGTFQACAELAVVAAKIGTVISRLSSFIGEAIEALTALLHVEDLVYKAEALVSNWGSDWAAAGGDAADIINDLSSFF